MIFSCSDGVERRFYPRIFTYSADYPEKYVLPSLLFHVTHAMIGSSWLQ